MNAFLIFFAIPFAVIVFSIALYRLLKCPVLVTAIIFAVLLIVALVAFSTDFLIAVIIYTILSYITVMIVRFFCNWNRNGGCCQSNGCYMSNSANAVNPFRVTLTAGNGTCNNVLPTNTGCPCNNNVTMANSTCNNGNTSVTEEEEYTPSLLYTCNPANNTNVQETNTIGRTGCSCGHIRRR